MGGDEYDDLLLSSQLNAGGKRSSGGSLSTSSVASPRSSVDRRGSALGRTPLASVSQSGMSSLSMQQTQEFSIERARDER